MIDLVMENGQKYEELLIMKSGNCSLVEVVKYYKDYLVGLVSGISRMRTDQSKNLLLMMRTGKCSEKKWWMKL